MANIDQTKELNKLLEAQAKIYAAQERSLKSQLNITQQLVTMMQNLSMDDAASNANELSSALEKAAKSFDEMERGQRTTDEIAKSLAKAVDGSDKFGGSLTSLGKRLMKIAPIAGVFEGVVAGLHVTRSAMLSVLSVTSSLATGLLNLGAAFLTAPFKILSFLMGQAQGGGAELWQAIEDVRKSFGDLAKNESRAIMDAWRSIDHFGGQLAETGLSIWRTMGNMAETMKVVHEIANNLGPTFSNLKRQLAQNVERIFAYQKGLGLSEEAMAGFGRLAQSMGMDLTEIGRQTTQMAYGLGDAFNINGKLIGRDIGEMIADFQNFGNLAISQLGSISVYARKLGVEVKALLGVIDTFDNFEDAATSVAQLSQAFGLQLDTLQLVQAQDPAERIEALRKSFFAAGRSIENMTRQERALLATQTGLDQNTLQLVFSQKNAAVSYEQIKKQSEASEKQQISQAEAMQKLADSIERLVRAGGTMETSFFKIFMDGFTRGARWTREWYGLMWNLRRAMREVRWAGMRVGQAFVKSFPGVQQMLTGLRDLFNRRRWHNMLFGSSGVVNTFRRFFKAIAGNDPMAVTNLFKSLKENFFDWFNDSSGAGRRVLSGLRSFFKASLTIAGVFFAESMKALGHAFKGLAGFIRDPSGFMAGAQSTKNGFVNFLSESLAPAWDAIVDAWPIFVDGFTELMKVVWDKIKPPMVKFFQDNFANALGLIFSPSIFAGVLRGLTFSFGGLLLGGLKGGLERFTSKGSSVVKGALGQLGRRFGAADVTKGSKGAQVAASSAANMSNSLEEVSKTNISRGAIGKMVVLGAVITIGLGAILAGIVFAAEYIQKNGISIGNIMSAGLAMVTAGIVMLEVAAVVRLLSAATQGIDGRSLGVGLAATAAAAIGLAGMAAIIVPAFKNITPTDTLRALAVMSAAAIMAAEAGLVALGLSFIGKITQSFVKEILIGMVAVGVVGAALAGGAYLLIEAFRGYSESDINKVSRLMDSTGGFFLTAMGVMFGAGLVGTIVTATAGIAAGMIVVGLATLSGVMISMVSTIKDVIKAASTIKITPASLSALDVFLKVLSAIGDFSKNVTGIVAATSPSLVDLIRGGEPMTDRLMEVGELIKTITGEMKDVVMVLIDEARELSSTEGPALKAAVAIASIISTISEAARNLQPGGEFLDVGFLDRISGETVTGRIRELGSYIKDVVIELKGTITDVVGEFSKIAVGGNFNEKTIEAAKAIGEIIASIGQLGRSLTVFISRQYATTDPETLRKLAPQIRATLKAILEAIVGDGGTNIFSRITETIGAVVDKIASLDRRQINRLRIASPIIEAAFIAMSSVAALIGNIGMGQVFSGTPEQSGRHVNNLIRIVEAITNGMGDSVGRVVTTLSETFKGLKSAQTANIKTGITGITDLFKSLEQIIDLSRTFKGSHADMQSSRVELSTFLATFLKFMSSGGKGELMGLLEFSRQLPTWLSLIGAQAESISQALPGFGDTLRHINTTALAIDRIFNTDAMKAIGELEEAGLQRIQTGVTAMVRNINDFGVALKNIKGIDLNAELQATSDRLGLKGNSELRINHHPVQLNIDVSVTIDSEELEKTLLERKNSRFATREPR